MYDQELCNRTTCLVGTCLSLGAFVFLILLMCHYWPKYYATGELYKINKCSNYEVFADPHLLQSQVHYNPYLFVILTTLAALYTCCVCTFLSQAISCCHVLPAITTDFT